MLSPEENTRKKKYNKTICPQELDSKQETEQFAKIKKYVLNWVAQIIKHFKLLALSYIMNKISYLTALHFMGML